MPVIIVRLEDILTSAKDPMDLASLPAEEAIAHVKRVYDFLPAATDISIAGGVVTIAVPDESAARAGQALEDHQRAVRMAERGRYHELQSLPGEPFSGLQLMCLMHVGPKRVDPSVDPGTGLDDAYAQTLGMYQADNRC